MNDLSRVKVGDELFHIQRGWLKVIAIIEQSPNPIKLQGFDGGFTFDGKANPYDYNPVLFLSEVRIEQCPTASLKSGILIETWDGAAYGGFQRALTRKFSHFDGVGRACCFSSDDSSTKDNEVFCWDNWKYIEQEDEECSDANLNVDELIEVWDDMEYACTGVVKNRRFSHFDEEGRVCCYGYDESSTSETKTVTAWDNWQHI